MKIAHIITRLVAGGAQRNTLICAAHQSSLGHDVTVVSGLETGSEGSLHELAERAAYRTLFLRPLVRNVDPVQDLQALVELVRLFRRERFELVHTHTSKAGILGRMAAALCGVPIVIHTPHGHVFHSYFNPWKTKAFELVERWVGPLADAMVFLTRRELHEHLCVKVVSQSQGYVIPSGVDLSSFLPLRSSAPGFVVGYVGRLASVKGPVELVEAFAIHAKTHPGSQLLLVGDGPERSLVEDSIAQLQIGCQVRLVGWQNRIESFLESMSVLVVPSLNEGMGRVVVEAMAAGLPVIATAVGGLLDLVEPGVTGFHVGVGDRSAMAEALDRLAEQPELRSRLGECGRQRAQEYSEQVMLDRLDRLYERLARVKGAVYLDAPIATAPPPTSAN